MNPKEKTEKLTMKGLLLPRYTKKTFDQSKAMQAN
jgi:hypothetical protein